MIITVCLIKWSLKTFLRLFAPFLPYITEEIWSCHHATQHNAPTIHTKTWPTLDEVTHVKTPAVTDLVMYAITLLSEIRGAKTTAQKNMKHPVKELKITCSKEDHDRTQLILEDLYRAGSIQHHAIAITGDPPFDIRREADGGIFEMLPIGAVQEHGMERVHGVFL